MKNDLSVSGTRAAASDEYLGLYRALEVAGLSGAVEDTQHESVKRSEDGN